MMKARRPEGVLPAPEAFEQFDAANPQVFEALVMLAREWRRRTGRDRVGIGMLYERARWELAIRTGDPDYRLNNNFRSFYARKIEHEVPDLAGMFANRRSEADEWAAAHYGEAA